jgi:hypothetical protein
VFRGGSYNDISVSLLSSFRSGGPPNNLFTDVGARCARTP